MKSKFIALLAVIVATAITYPAVLRAAETNAPLERIGTYDSRIIAYAYFWSETHQRKQNEMIRAARDAKAAGQTKNYNELNAVLEKQQKQIHLQVFSTAPASDALGEIKDRLPAIQKEAGVSKLISKWDEAALKQHPKAQQVDVTDLLVREFKPSEKQLKMMAEIKKNQPVPLEKMKNMKDH